MFQQTFLESTKSSDSKKPKKAQIIIKNPLKKNIYVNTINLICDIYFSLYGRCEVKINGDSKFMPDDDSFKLRKEITIPLENQILERGKSIEVFVWNPVNDDIVELSVQAIISEFSGNLVLSGQAIDDNTMLTGIAGGAGDENDTHDIFPYRIYHNEVIPFLINTKGRNNMLLTMASSSVSPPQIIDNDFATDPSPNYTTRITTNPDTTPDLRHSDYEDEVTIRNPVTVFSGNRHEGYYVTDYRNLFNNCTMLDGTALSDFEFSDFTDLFILIDSENSDQKNIRFNFATSLLDGSIDAPLMCFLKEIERKYQRSRSYYVSGSYLSHPLYSWSDWSDYVLISTVNKYAPVQVRLLYDVDYVVESSDDMSFENPQNLDTIRELSVTKQYQTSHRYIRIRRVIKPNRLEYEELDVSEDGQLKFASVLGFPVLNNPVDVTNLIDTLSHGGTARLYFQLKGVNDEWFTVLDSSQLNAVTQGESKLIQYDIKGIPPSQSRFRAILEVTGSLKTGVTIDLVA